MVVGKDTFFPFTMEMVMVTRAADFFLFLNFEWTSKINLTLNLLLLHFLTPLHSPCCHQLSTWRGDEFVKVLCSSS